MTDYLDVSRRDVGAGITAGGSALLAAVLVNPWNVVQTFRARGFDSVSIVAYRRGSEIVFLGMIVAPVIAVFVGTVVWRVLMPDEPDPSYGAIAGVITGFGSLFVFAALIGLIFSLNEFSAGVFAGLSELVFITILIAAGVSLSRPSSSHSVRLSDIAMSGTSSAARVDLLPRLNPWDSPKAIVISRLRPLGGPCQCWWRAENWPTGIPSAAEPILSIH